MLVYMFEWAQYDTTYSVNPTMFIKHQRLMDKILYYLLMVHCQDCTHKIMCCLDALVFVYSLSMVVIVNALKMVMMMLKLHFCNGSPSRSATKKNCHNRLLKSCVCVCCIEYILCGVYCVSDGWLSCPLKNIAVNEKDQMRGNRHAYNDIWHK